VACLNDGEQIVEDEVATRGIGKSPFDDAELYDVLFGDFAFDRDFYLELARDANGPVLEVACGTGRILIPCLQAGVDIDGLDLYPSMVEVLRHKAGALGLNPRLYVADMCAFKIPRRYRLIFIAFNGFVHNLTTADQIKTLEACREHLLPGGSLVFNVFYPGLEIIGGPEGSPVLELEAKHPVTGLPVRIYDTRQLNRVDQIQHSSIEIQELDVEGGVAARHLSETWMRWTFKPEMELLLETAGFAEWQIFGGFDRRPLTRETDLMVIFASNH
jgi:SAM-dependent methyltransferase